MARILAYALAGPHGDAATCLRALTAGSEAPPPRDDSPLAPRLLALAKELLSEHSADLILLAGAKGDCALYAEQLLSSEHPDGSPLALAQFLSTSLAIPCHVVAGACASGPLALGEAARALHCGDAQRVLVLAGERLAPFVDEGFAALRALDPERCRPYDHNRAGLILGDGVAGMVLGNGHGGLQLQGWGGSLDASHLTAPHPRGDGLALAARQACTRAAIAEPGWICGHGTGTRANDDAEIACYQQLAWPSPVVGWKGCLGHGLGATGLVEAVLCAEILSHGRPLPGTVGLDTSIDSHVLRGGPHPPPPGPALSVNAGFGGLNGAVVFGDRAPQPLSVTAATCTARSRIEPEQGVLPKRSAKQVLGHIDAGWGRLDLSCRLLVELASGLGDLPEGSALILASDSGCRATDAAYEAARRATGAEAQRFVYTLASIPVGEASIRCNLHGPGFTLQGCSDSQLRRCAERLLAEGHPAVVVARIETDAAPIAWAERWEPARSS
ncbi:MAG: beta-ketoacyl synthase N-terminal-like domain-containing protein [Planctomycetota bacterium]|jgi:3-oxoacyl-[acyl-carrier-protein] synthase-1|nr:beta-ketoacyl synthase N-terminal-like domain-containing protein [Planctomycetota bacterium]